MIISEYGYFLRSVDDVVKDPHGPWAGFVEDPPENMPTFEAVQRIVGVKEIRREDLLP